MSSSDADAASSTGGISESNAAKSSMSGNKICGFELQLLQKLLFTMQYVHTSTGTAAGMDSMERLMKYLYVLIQKVSMDASYILCI